MAFIIRKKDKGRFQVKNNLLSPIFTRALRDSCRSRGSGSRAGPEPLARQSPEGARRRWGCRE